MGEAWNPIRPRCYHTDGGTLLVVDSLHRVWIAGMASAPIRNIGALLHLHLVDGDAHQWKIYAITAGLLYDIIQRNHWMFVDPHLQTTYRKHITMPIREEEWSLANSRRNKLAGQYTMSMHDCFK